MLTVIRNPVQLAKCLASLDQLSNGRLTVGVGIGGPHASENVFGISGERRARQFIEGIKVMKALWAEPRASFSGEFWRFQNVPMEPKPIQKPVLPLWIGAREPVGLKRAVSYGDGWIGAGSSSSADFVKQVSQIRHLLDGARRDPATFAISKRVYVAIDHNHDRAERRLREWFAVRYKNSEMAARVSIWGSTKECVDKLGELVDSGAKHLLLNPVFDEMEHLEALATDVLPQL